MYQCVACDYYGTGEGRTVCLLITRAYPKATDFDDEQKVKNSVRFRAAREFNEIFGEFHTRMAENITMDIFIEKYKSLLPPMTMKVLGDTGQDGPGNFRFFQEFHVNYS